MTKRTELFSKLQEKAKTSPLLFYNVVHTIKISNDRVVNEPDKDDGDK